MLIEMTIVIWGYTNKLIWFEISSLQHQAYFVYIHILIIVWGPENLVSSLSKTLNILLLYKYISRTYVL